jgi:hypothetical protein
MPERIPMVLVITAEATVTKAEETPAQPEGED